ncbi:MAG: hypothetical protein ACQEQU_04425 [Spirochaetota bacterium]
MKQSAFARIILLSAAVFVLAFTFSACRRSSDLVLVADPIFAGAVLPEDLPEEIQQRSDMSVRVIVYDGDQDTGEVERTLRQLTTPLLVFSPLLSQHIQDGKHPDVAAAAASESTEIVYMVTEKQAQRFEGLSQRFLLVYSPQDGWHQVDRMLSEQYDDHSRVGILFDSQQYGGAWEPRELFPQLFDSSESREPELVMSQEGGFSRSRINEALASFEQKQVEVVCLVIGSSASEALSSLEKHDMLAVVEHGGGLVSHSDQLAAVIDIDYPATLQRLSEEVLNEQPQRHIPLSYRLLEIERTEQVEE